MLSGNQVDVPVSAPVDVSGNGAALLGTTHATSRGGVKVRKRGGDGRTSGAHGIASGNQVNAPISLPVNVCGNGAAVLGEADAGCRGGASAGGGGAGGGQRTDGTGGVLAGNQVHAPISIPVNVCGNAVAVAGEAVGGCEGGARVKTGGDTGSGQQTSGIVGVGAGNQADVPISVPVDICGNAVGNAAAACEGGASVRNGGHRTGRQTTAGDLGVIAGNQGNAPVSIPLTVCGNAAAVAGQAAAFCEGGAHARSSSGGDQRTSGVGGVLAGNQGNTPVTAPAEVCGNAAAVVGLAGASCNGQTLVEGSQGSGAQTSGGNQANAPVKAPRRRLRQRGRDRRSRLRPVPGRPRLRRLPALFPDDRHRPRHGRPAEREHAAQGGRRARPHEAGRRPHGGHSAPTRRAPVQGHEEPDGRTARRDHAPEAPARHGQRRRGPGHRPRRAAGRLAARHPGAAGRHRPPEAERPPRPPASRDGRPGRAQRAPRDRRPLPGDRPPHGRRPTHPAGDRVPLG
ncbi:DUF320 domain-containing protein [Actinomadura madurae]|nr:DUF320 domain-containing protein [Actinomadura madurae]